MLPKGKRLTTEEFKETFKVGRRYNTSSLLCVYCDASKSAISVAVTKKHYPRAVDRNRLRRLVYGCIETLPIQKSIIILLNKKISPKEENILCAEVSSFIHSL
jgi:ribonuclease P protein component